MCHIRMLKSLKSGPERPHRATDTAPLRVDLLRDGVVIDTKDVKAADNWTPTIRSTIWVSLITTGHIYTYTVRSMDNAQSRLTTAHIDTLQLRAGDVTSGFTITNKSPCQ